MENYAKKIAIEHKITGKAISETFPIKRLIEDFKIISIANKVLNECITLDVAIPPSGEWLLDNFYLIEEQVNSTKNELKENEYLKLPSINGMARNLILAKELVNFTDGNITTVNIENFLNAYQTKKVIEMREIWTFPIMLKIALVEYIRKVSERIIVAQYQKLKVESLVERLVKKVPTSKQKFSKYKNLQVDSEATSYVEHLMYLLKKIGNDGVKFLEILEDEVKKVGTTVSNVIKVEHYDLTLKRVSIGNSITSIRRLARLNWSIIFENTNEIDNILKQDEWYEKLDYETKEEYRNIIQRIADKTQISEIYIANKLIELSNPKQILNSEKISSIERVSNTEKASNIERVSNTKSKSNLEAELKSTTREHIGVFLIGDRKAELYQVLGFKYKESKHKLVYYLLAIYLPTLIFSYALTGNLFWLAFIPVSEIFVSVINRIVSKKIIPQKLPRLEKIDENVNTFVIVPTLLNSEDRVRKMMESLEVYYLANQSENLFFALLGDVSEVDKEVMDYDEAIMRVGQKEAEKLNKKYGKEIFYFLYRKRIYNPKQGKWLGYERKRGMITEFNEFLLTGSQGTFQINTIKNIPQIKYVITLDADTELPMDSAKKLIGIMEHPLNKPVIENGIVAKGYGLVQPKVGISIKASTESLFSKIYAGSGGIDIYSTAESNVYQDLFGEAIFTGKGIYNLQVFHDVLHNQIPENKVLSHDLLEGSYLRCGLASDVEIIDGFPSRVNSYMVRQQRWVRGDWQIISWLTKGPLNALSKYKIFDNLRRSLVDVLTFVLMLTGHIFTALLVVFIPLIIDILDKILNINASKKKAVTKDYLPKISGIKGSLYRSFLNLLFVPYKFVLMLEAIIKTLYRLFISKKNLLEWLTAADAEKVLGKDLWSFFREMDISHLLGWVLLLTMRIINSDAIIIADALTILWFLTPFIAYEISLPEKQNKHNISSESKEFVIDVAKKTWGFFNDYMIKENNFLPPDNYQEKRKNSIVNITSSTNIGLGLLAVISAYDMKFIDEDKLLELLKNIIGTISKLDKWNGHLYNWYNIKTLEALNPKFVSTVDSGNFVGYLYSVKEFLNGRKKELEQKIEELNENTEELNKNSEVLNENTEVLNENIEVLNKDARLLNKIYDYEFLFQTVSELINQTDFSKLYDESKNLFSVGYDFRENCLVDSYYDLLASEARQASFIAIVKRDIPYKHWFNLGRTLTTLNTRKGLVSWAGTMFEYFMPSIVMESYRYTLLDETYDFCIYSQKEYAKRLKIPWGISESAFNLFDLNYNYQYKAFGIPWLGVKRGLKDEIVVSPYSSIMAISRDTENVINNLYELEKLGAYQKYGFYESIDYTPNRTFKDKYIIVKTYMAHHQGLILTAINNFMNDNILVKRFSENPEIKMASMLLQEKVPQNIVYTNEKKEKIKAIKYKYYEEYNEKEININEQNVNILSNDNYTLLIDNYGQGYSAYKGKMINRFKENNYQTNFFYIKNISTKECWSNVYYPNIKEPDEYKAIFSSAVAKFFRKDGDIITTTKVAVSPEDNIEIRQLEIENNSYYEMDIDVISYLDPIICDKDTDITFPAFNKLFLYPQRYKNAIILEKRERNSNVKNMNLLTTFFEMPDEQGFEVETDKIKILGNCNNIDSALIINQDKNYSQELKLCTDSVISYKKNVKIKPGEKIRLYFAIAISADKEELEDLYSKIISNNFFDRTFELAISKSVVENRYLGFKSEDIELYNKLINEIINGSSTRKRYLKQIESNLLKQKDLWKFGISGDLPIILVRIKNPNEIEMVSQLIKSMEYFNRKNIKLDLVIIDDEKNSYEQYTFEKIYECINSKNINYLLNVNGGIHIIKRMNISEAEINLLYSCSDIILDAHLGIMEEQLYENRRFNVL